MGTREFGQEFEGYANTSFYFDSGCNTESHFFSGGTVISMFAAFIFINFRRSNRPNSHLMGVARTSFLINIETLLHNRATCSTSRRSQALVAMFAGFSVS